MSLLRRALRAAPALAVVLVAAALVGSGCGVTSSGSSSDPSSSAVTPSSAHIITRTATATSSEDTDNHHLQVSVSCRRGEQMLAGGYSLQDVFESDYFLLANYPSAPRTWTVSTDSGSHYQLQTIVYCLSGYPLLGLRILQAKSCPAGTVATAAGFSRTSLDAPVESTTSYVVCGSHLLTATGSGFWVGTTSIDCTTQSTGDNLSETRSFAYTCSVTQAATPTASTANQTLQVE